MNISSQTLVTDNLVIRTFGQEHLSQDYVNWLNDKVVVKYSEQRHKVHTLETCLKYWKFIQDSTSLFWAIETKDQVHIGNLTVHFDTPNATADIGILIGNTSYWNKGFGQEAFSAACEYLLQHETIRKVTAGTMSVNVGMRKVMMSSGMVEEGVRKRHFLLDGQEVDLIFAAKYRTRE